MGGNAGKPRGKRARLLHTSLSSRLHEKMPPPYERGFAFTGNLYCQPVWQKSIRLGSRQVKQIDPALYPHFLLRNTRSWLISPQSAIALTAPIRKMYARPCWAVIFLSSTAIKFRNRATFTVLELQARSFFSRDLKTWAGKMKKTRLYPGLYFASEARESPVSVRSSLK